MAAIYLDPLDPLVWSPHSARELGIACMIDALPPPAFRSHMVKPWSP